MNEHPSWRDHKELQGRLKRVEAEHAALREKYTLLVQSFDEMHGTPCEQIRHQQEIDRLIEQATISDARIAQLVTAIDGYACEHDTTYEFRLRPHDQKWMAGCIALVRGMLANSEKKDCNQ